MDIHKIHEQRPMPWHVQNSRDTSEPWDLGFTGEEKPTVAAIYAEARRESASKQKQYISPQGPFKENSHQPLSPQEELPPTQGTFEVDSYWALSLKEEQRTQPQPDTTQTTEANRQTTGNPKIQKKRRPLHAAQQTTCNPKIQKKRRPLRAAKEINYSSFHTRGERQPLS